MIRDGKSGRTIDPLRWGLIPSLDNDPKIAMRTIHQGLHEEDLQTRMILQVHDELVLEAPDQDTERVGLLVKEAMESAAVLAVPLVVDVGVGGNWREAH